MPGVVETHIKYLADATRIAALRRAIDATVRPGDIVVDIGAGTGVLALMACAAGARRVYAIERGPVIELARKIATANGYREQITFIRQPSSHVQLPELGDVLVSDLVGPFAFESGLFDVLIDARGRLLKPDGRTIPAAVTLCAALLESERLRERMAFAEQHPAGFDMSALAHHAKNTAYHIYPESDSLLSTAIELAQWALPPATLPSFDREASVLVERDGHIDAIAGWFEAELAPGVRMTNSPSADDRLDRRVVALPVSPAISVREGDTVAIALRLLTSDHVYQWRVQRLRTGHDVSSATGCTLGGLLLSREDLVTFERRA